MSGEFVRGGAAPDISMLRLRKAAPSSVVTEIASGGAGVSPVPETHIAPPAAEVTPSPAPQPVQEAPAPPPVYVEPHPADTREAAPAESEVEAPKNVKTSLRHTKEQARRLRATYIATMRQHRRRSLSDWLSDIIDAECTRLEQELNDGRPFDDDPELPKGRPLSS